VLRCPAGARFSLVLLGAMSMGPMGAVWAAAVGPAPPVHGPQLMLYFTQPLWSRGVSVRMYGLKIDRLRTLRFSPRSPASDYTQRTALIDLQLRARSDVRVEFGRHVTWNLGRGEFGPSAGTVGFQMPTRSSELAAALSRPPWVPERFGMNASATYLAHRQATDAEQPMPGDSYLQVDQWLLSGAPPLRGEARIGWRRIGHGNWYERQRTEHAGLHEYSLLSQ
jgi:hypothetical protein